MGNDNESIDVDAIKKAIEERVGIPADLLKSETPEALIMEARSLLDYKRQYENGRPKSNREQFAAWLGEVRGDPQTDEPGAALEEIATETADKLRGYPQLKDAPADDIVAQYDNRASLDKFREWLDTVGSFDPAKGPEGWSRLI